MKDRRHFFLMASIWGWKNRIRAHNEERAARWFAVAARYREVQP